MARVLLLITIFCVILPADASGGLFRRRGRSGRNHCHQVASFPGYATPKAAWQARETAIANNDWKTYSNSLSPKYQLGISFMMIVSGLEDIALGPRDRAQKIIAVHKRHGIDLAEISRELDEIGEKTPDIERIEKINQYLLKKVRAIQNHGQFYADRLRVERKINPDEFVDYTRYVPIPIRSIKIEGDKAWGLTTRGETQTKVGFVRVAGRWYFEPDSF